MAHSGLSDWVLASSDHFMIKEKLRTVVEDALAEAVKENRFSALLDEKVTAVIEKPKLAEHGDFACGVALKLASKLKSAPFKIAETIAEYIRKDEAAKGFIAKVDVVQPGYINFQLDNQCLVAVLKEIHQAKNSFGKGVPIANEKILLEYVSANPTGELHIGHGRNAVFGSSLANLLRFFGYDVTEEFLVNDAGEQMLHLGRCAWALYQNQFGRSVPYPEEGYPEYLLIDFVKTISEKHGDSLLSIEKEEEAQEKLGRLTADAIIEHQKELLSRMGVNFALWFSETTLHRANKVNDVLELFKAKGTSYESEGALWLKAKELGDERDRVLKKSSGTTTYLAGDAAYHLDKLNRGYTHLINIWGADHHGQIPGIKATLTAMGRNANALEIVLTQIVNLQRDGKMVRMSKRAGTVVTLSEVVEEVGVDAVRYYLAETNPQNPINFDLELAKKTSRENPAFYIQYAHARCCSILRRSLEPTPSEENPDAPLPAAVTEESWAEYKKLYLSDAEVFLPAFDQDQKIFQHQKKLIMTLELFPEEVAEAVQTRLPGRIARYAYEVANDFQKFYEVSRVITDDTNVTRARLGIVDATRQVLANALSIIGVSAPERM